jgi:hypothetical protein
MQHGLSDFALNLDILPAVTTLLPYPGGIMRWQYGRLGQPTGILAFMAMAGPGDSSSAVGCGRFNTHSNDTSLFPYSTPLADGNFRRTPNYS